MAQAGSRSWPLGTTLAIFLSAWAMLSWPWLSGAVTIPWDAKAHFYPQLQFLAQSLHRGDTPFWAPFVFSGTPQIADPQSLIFSPTYFVLALANPDPSFRAADAAVLVRLATGGAALIMLFRDRGWHPAGALVAALGFAFGASAAWRIQHVGQVLSLADWTIALWLLLRALDRRSVPYGVLAGIATGFMALNRDQVAYLGLWLLVGVVLWHWLTGPKRMQRFYGSLRPLSACILGAILVAALPILLTALLADASNRPAITYEQAAQGSLHPALLLTVAIPNLFGVDGPFMDYWGPPSPRWGSVDLYLARNMGVLYLGALPFVAIVLGAARGVFWRSDVRFFTLAFLAALLYALGRYTPVLALVFKVLPGIDLFRRPADATFLIGASAAILAGYALHRWLTDEGSGFRRAGVATILVLAAPFPMAVALAIQKDTLALAAWPLAKAAFCLAVGLAVLSIVRRLQSAHAVLGTVALVLATDLAWNNGPNESTALPPETYEVLRLDSTNPTLRLIRSHLGEGSLDRVELTGLGFQWPNASLVHRLHHMLGYNPIRLGLYSRATGAGDHAALPDQRQFAPLFPSYRSALADLLGLRLIVTGIPIERIDPALKPGDLTMVAQTPDGFVYENSRAMPRAHFAVQAQPANFEQMLRDGRWPDVDLTNTVLLEADAPMVNARGARSDGSVRVISYGNSEVVMEVEAGSDGYAVLSDPYHPWWFAELDGRDASLLRANVLFRAVPVPAGRHTLRMYFDPLQGLRRQLRARWFGE